MGNGENRVHHTYRLDRCAGVGIDILLPLEEGKTAGHNFRGLSRYMYSTRRSPTCCWEESAATGAGVGKARRESPTTSECNFRCWSPDIWNLGPSPGNGGVSPRQARLCGESRFSGLGPNCRKILARLVLFDRNPTSTAEGHRVALRLTERKTVLFALFTSPHHHPIELPSHTPIPYTFNTSYTKWLPRRR
jgi:hypothetical protein